jgi:tripartite-type tricarboxylate transporter receptor subunit TctC
LDRFGAKKILLTRLLTCIAILAALAPARAEDYPTRALRVITANSAGGTSDIFVRALAEKLQARLGQPVIVENRPGGAMIISGRACADAANDGYTICLSRLTDIGIVPVFDTPEHLAQYLEEQRANGARLIRESGFQPR